MDRSDTFIAFAEESCRKNGKRLTPKRKTIMLALLETQKAISAYELVDYCKKRFKEVIPVMSVYRILDFLQEQGLAHRLDLANKYVACSHAACGHKHELSHFLICDQCQRVEEVALDQETLQRLQDTIGKTGFHFNNLQLEMNGVCNHCIPPGNHQ